MTTIPNQTKQNTILSNENYIVFQNVTVKSGDVTHTETRYSILNKNPQSTELEIIHPLDGQTPHAVAFVGGGRFDKDGLSNHIESLEKTYSFIREINEKIVELESNNRKVRINNSDYKKINGVEDK